MSLSKLFQRIIFHNNTTPAINEDNLNAMSKAIDDIDDRVILIGDDVVTVIPQIQAYLEQAESIVEAVEELSQNPPYIGANGNWYVFDTTLEAYKDSGVDASITVDIADITMIAVGAQPYVTNTGTSTDPVFHLFLPQSPQGETGNGIANIAKTSTQGLVDTYTITMTDGTTYTFTVTNGQNGSGTGDMLQSDYDSDSTVKNAGGIADYVEGKVAPMLNVLGAKNLLPNTVASQTINGVTFTVNADGSISCSGTSTAEMWIAVNTKTPLDPTKEYILSGCPSGGDESNTYSLYASDDATVWKFDEGSGVSFTPTGANNTTVTIHIKNDINMTGKVFKPMLRLSSIADSTYEPYSMTNQQLTPYAQSQSNPNLLDNPWFTVNQRGASSITTAWAYFVDRWRSGGNITEIDLNADNSITLKSGGACDFVQGIPYSELTLGKSYVLSVLLSNGQIYHTSPFIITQRSTWGVFSDTVLIGNNCYLRADGDSAGFAAVITSPNVSSDLTIKAMKLESGTVSTLAQDTAPNYATELLKCQRYFVRLANPTGLAFSGWVYNTNARGVIVLPTAMRSAPTVTKTGNAAWIMPDGTGRSSTTLTVNTTNNQEITLGEASVFEDVTSAICILRPDSNAILDFSAEL